MWWTGPDADLDRDWQPLVRDPAIPLAVVGVGDGLAAARGGRLEFDPSSPSDTRPVVALIPALPPRQLGDESFRRDHRLKYNYVTGAMANGIGSVELVTAIGRAGMLGFFGSAGLSVARVAEAIDRLRDALGDSPHGFNLIHSPIEPRLEAEIVELYLRRDVHLVEASAYLDLTPPVVRYRVSGLRRHSDGRVVARNRVIAKVSRVEVATKFLAPPPERIVRELLAAGKITAEEAELAPSVPMADDLTAEADSGGHTDNRPLIALLPTLLDLRDRLQAQYQYPRPPRVGAAGGISTPASAAAAFALGAAYVVTGTINQACVESGSSDRVRAMLAAAGPADVTMAPAADMFEMGVKLQVLKRGTMFPQRSARLYELYRAYASLEEIPAGEREKLERDVFRLPLDRVWQQTRDFWSSRDPAQLERAERDPKHRMALVFRWYLGLSSRWANAGDPDRVLDYQVWCGPAMGAFNEWVRGSFLERPENRAAAVVARNLMRGAAIALRVGLLRNQGVPVPPELARIDPLPDDSLGLEG